MADGEALRRRADAAEAREARLRAYAQHDAECPKNLSHGVVVMGSQFRRQPCSCGLDELLADAEGQHVVAAEDGASVVHGAAVGVTVVVSAEEWRALTALADATVAWRHARAWARQNPDKMLSSRMTEHEAADVMRQYFDKEAALDTALAAVEQARQR